MSKIRLNWITGKRLLKRWNIDIRELDICIKSGLQVYNPKLDPELFGPFRNRMLNSDYNPNDDSCSYETIHSHDYGHIIYRKNNLYDFQMLLNSSNPLEDTGLTKDQILDNLLFKLKDVEQFEKKHPKKTGIGSRPRKPISLDKFPQDNSQVGTGGGKVSKIEVPWINGRRLIERWKMRPYELYQAIFFLHLPVYDSDYNKQDRIIYEESTNINGGAYGDEPIFHTVGPNNLFYFDRYINADGIPQFDDWDDLYKILDSMLFSIEDVKRFESKYGKFSDSKNEFKGLSTKDARELGRLRREKSKWYDSIKASLQIGLFCNELSKGGKKITRDMLYQKLSDLKFKDLPNTTIEKIWKAIPEKYRKKAGRPTKNKT